MNQNLKMSFSASSFVRVHFFAHAFSRAHTHTHVLFPRIRSSFCFVAFWGFPLFSTSQATTIFFAGVLVPAGFVFFRLFLRMKRSDAPQRSGTLGLRR